MEPVIRKSKGKLGGGILACGLMVMLLGLWPAAGGATIYTLTPEADSFVAQVAPDTNYGTDWLLRVGTNIGDPTNFRRTFLRFNLTGIPAGEQITQATLSLFTQSGPSTSFTIDLRHVATDTWLESGITWNNQPGSGNTLDNQAVSGGYGTVVTWNLLAQTGNWNWQADLSDNLLSLVLRMPTESSATATNIAFRDDDSSIVPVLNITTSPVPLPSTFLLLGSGLLGLAGLRRFRKG